MISKITAGNTIYIKWTVRKNDSILKDNLSVKLYDVFRKECAITYEIEESEDNKNFIINITYPGNKQFTFGKYSVVLFNNVDDVKQNKLIYKDAFILVHALKNRIICYGDELLDDSVLVEIDSDLNIALQNQEIQDKTQILEKIETLNSSVQDLKDEIDNIQDKIDFSDINSSIEILDNSVNYIIDDIKNSERVLVEYFTVIDNSVNMLMNSSKDSTYDDTELRTMISNTDTSIIDVSTRLKDLSTYTHDLDIPEEYDDTELSNKVNDVSTRLKDLSTYTHNLVIPEEYDDTELRDLITSSNSSISNISTKLNNVSIIVDNLVSTGYDDTVIKNRIADVSQYAINLSTRVDDAYHYAEYAVEKDSLNTALIIHINSSLLDISTKLNDLSTYTHNLNIPEEYDDSELSNKVNDVSTKLNDLSTYTHNLTPGSGDVDLTDVNSSISDLSTRIQIIENSSNYTDWTDTFYYTPYNFIMNNFMNTSAWLFQDVILNVSSLNDNVNPNNYGINLKDTYTNSDSEVITIANTNITWNRIKYWNKTLDIRQVGQYVTDNTFNVTGNWYAFHFPHVMKIVGHDASVSATSGANQVAFKIISNSKE